MNKIIWNESFRANVKAKKGKVVFFLFCFLFFYKLSKNFTWQLNRQNNTKHVS